jgi:sensor histidine kinase regulating citrate/malate metabolism
MRNMLRNVAQHTGVKPARIKVKMELDTESKMLTMDFAHLGSSISRKIRKQLFRLPIRHAENGRTGIGLWTIGMAFEAQHLAVPQVIQSEEGVHFVFRFPVV